VEAQTVAAVTVGGLLVAATFVVVLLVRDVFDSDEVGMSKVVARVGLAIRLMAVVAGFFIVVFSYRLGYLVSGSQVLAAVSISIIAVLGFVLIRPVSRLALPSLRRWVRRLGT
jgi:hypothetical protein